MKLGLEHYLLKSFENILKFGLTGFSSGRYPSGKCLFSKDASEEIGLNNP